ncbi:allantoicase [Oceanobacter sp. 4_MG-2023]|uniref:allantoicase n=1 Tax=Oceanobacter sp. 4_MG-2023 TaxID=3062623 RepID=UPI0027322E70|nr:allantoicase [Oceanobacter sp. 4_MG-2023]MDP2548388.1 allantoicase [Oceanobacter sp. 4_MG-2023]
MNTEQLRQYVNLASARLGAKVIAVTDDWFAAADRMLNPEEPVWQEGVYDDNGKWMDGWESRRKRGPGYDHAVVRLGVAGVIKAVDIDTRYFTGNYPPSASLEGCFCPEGDPNNDTAWQEVLPSVSLQGNSQHVHPIASDQPWTHLRLNIFPDGGVARLKVYGVPYRDWSTQSADELIDLAAALNGGRALACNDQHFGHMSNLIAPGRGINMGDGWETARRRTPGFDWVILALGHKGTIEELIIDTLHFKGNYPDSCSIQAACVTGGSDDQIEAQSLYWQELLPSQKLQMNQEHTFKEQLQGLGAVTHIRINIFPDGGISRVRAFGKISQ